MTETEKTARTAAIPVDRGRPLSPVSCFGEASGEVSDPGPDPTADERDDQRLVERLAIGDRNALGELYDRHAGSVLAVALRVLGDRGDAEDLVHDVFVETWQRAGDYDAARGTVRRWLRMRARSRAIDRVRALAAARRHGMSAARERPDSDRHAYLEWDGTDRSRAREALDALPEPQRRLIELSYFEGLTCAEMAARCGIPIGTVKSRLSAAMGKLRKSLAVGEGAP